MLRIAALLAVLFVSACTPTRQAPPPPVVLLVSLDGFRPSELGQGLTPHLDAIAAGGVRAEAMRPSYPTLTFPNHYTLVTGLRPDRHGVIHNTIRDAELGRFRISDPKAVTNAGWWGGEPLWSTAEKAGIPTATMFWPGSEAPIGGVRPREWRVFDESFRGEDRVDTVLGWLGRDASTRPRFVTLYFEDLDEASHDHGPDSPQARAAVVRLDRLIGRLVTGIEARGLAGRVDLVIVSDHGMAEVAPRQHVLIDDMAPREIAENITSGQSVGFRPRPGREAEARARLLGRHAHYECWTRETLPARWHYGRHPRVPPILCQMDEGWDAIHRDRAAERLAGGLRGSHGFDPQLPSMAALFIADGPSFRDGVRLPAFDNVDVYPLLARLVGVEPLEHDGDPRTLEPALRTR